jgi:acyl-CoA synthetase (AMP-forming)/AMP-acid ligase II
LDNIAEGLILNVARYPDKTAVVYKERRITFRELNNRVNRLANHLLELGIQKGDRIGFMLYNSNQFIEIFYASMKIGAIAVPINFRLVPREVKWIADNSGCKVFVYSKPCADQVDPVKKDFATVEHLLFSGPECPEGEYDFDAFTRDGESGEPSVSVAFEDKAYIMYTGGTTGLPKGAMHTHRGTHFASASSLILRRSSHDECILNQLPLFHIAGLNLMIQNIEIGGNLILVETFDPVELLKLIDGEKPTLLFLLPPATYIRLLDVPDIKNYDTSSVLKVGGAAGALPEPLMLRLFDAFPNGDIFFGYGLSEGGAAGVFHYITRDLVQNKAPQIKGIGREAPYLQVRLVDDEGREVPVGEVGEATIKSPAIMTGYFEQPELTAQTIKDGWLHTGDLFRMDKNRFFYFVDRKKDMIKSGGENVFAQEVEAIILSHGSVELCAVFGVPDPKFGEAVMAAVKLRQGCEATEEEIIEHCKKSLASYKKPRRVVFVDEFPIGGGSKIQKYKLREQYSQK